MTKDAKLNEGRRASKLRVEIVRAMFNFVDYSCLEWEDKLPLQPSYGPHSTYPRFESPVEACHDWVGHVESDPVVSRIIVQH